MFGRSDGHRIGGVLTTSRRIGFRFVALVTADDSDPAKLAGKDGSGDFTMRMNVNGAQVRILLPSCPRPRDLSCACDLAPRALALVTVAPVRRSGREGRT